MTASATSLDQACREVLVVEDEARVRAMLEQALRTMGFAPTFAGSAEAAARTLAARPFDVMILDLNLPGMTALSFWNRPAASTRSWPSSF